MKPKFGFELLQQQVLDQVDGELMWMINDRETGDSEIEKLLFLAIQFRIQYGFSEFEQLLKPSDAEKEKSLLRDSYDPWTTFFVRAQAKIGGYRVDFLAHSLDHRRSGNERSWRRLVIECDGHQFHERTKEQAARDRSRDRWLTANGYDVFRFTGSELWRDPMACAEQVLDWGSRGW